LRKAGFYMMLVIFGPTVSGKTSLAITLAKKFNGEIISADSRQIYKSLDIGTGKIPFESKFEKHDNYWIVDGIKINGFDILDPQKSFSSADFKNFASPIINNLQDQNILPVVAGGSGFYIKTLLSNYSTFGILQNPKLRKELEKKSAGELYDELLKINKIKALSLNDSDKKNPRRLIRAIEVTSYQSIPKNPTTNHQPFILPKEGPTTNILMIGLNAPNSYLFGKADDWLDLRLKKGLIEEVDALLTQKITSAWLDSLGLEYRWISRYLLNKIDKDTAIERLKGDIHSLIRRQKTYFSQFKDINIYDVSRKGWERDLENEVTAWNKKQMETRRYKCLGRE